MDTMITQLETWWNNYQMVTDNPGNPFGSIECRFCKMDARYGHWARCPMTQLRTIIDQLKKQSKNIKSNMAELIDTPNHNGPY